MSKEIEGGIVVINTLTRATEETDYPIVMASDVDLNSGISVEDKFTEIENLIGSGGVEMSEIDDTVISEDFTWSSKLISDKLIELKENSLSADNVYKKEQTYTKEEVNSLVTESISNELSQYSTTEQTETMVSEATSNVVQEAQSYVDQKCQDIANDVDAIKTIVGDGFEEFDEEYILSLFADE